MALVRLLGYRLVGFATKIRIVLGKMVIISLLVCVSLLLNVYKHIAMQKAGRKKFLALVTTLLISLLCLAQTACKPTPANTQHSNTKQNAAESDEVPPPPSIEADKFRVELQEIKNSRYKNHFVLVHITPGSSGMKLEEFFITASVVGGQGELKGANNKSGNKLKYNIPINNEKRSLKELYAISSNCIGSEDTTFEQGKQTTFKLQCTPKISLKLEVTIAREGSNPHLEKVKLNLSSS